MYGRASVWSEASWLPLFPRAKAPASRTHSKRFAQSVAGRRPSRFIKVFRGRSRPRVLPSRDAIKVFISTDEKLALADRGRGESGFSQFIPGDPRKLWTRPDHIHHSSVVQEVNQP